MVMKKVLFIVCLGLLFVSCIDRHHIREYSDGTGVYNDYVTSQLNTLKKPIVLVAKTRTNPMNPTDKNVCIIVIDGNKKFHMYNGCAIVNAINESVSVNDTIAYQ